MSVTQNLPAGGPPTERSLAKAGRRSVLLDAAARLFAQRGYNGVSMEDLGAAAGVSGPAVYRHFSGKPAVLAALLVGVSQDLLDGGSAVAAAGGTPRQTLEALIAFHVDFALSRPEVIRVQDRDMDSLGAEEAASVRRLQRAYIDVWVNVLARLHRQEDQQVLRLRAQATFGLINSTPHTVHRSQDERSPDGSTAEWRRTLLEKMAWAALAV